MFVILNRKGEPLCRVERESEARDLVQMLTVKGHKVKLVTMEVTYKELTL